MSGLLEYSATQYQDKFDPKTYLEWFYPTIEGNGDEDGCIDKLKLHHEFWFEKFQPASSPQAAGVRCLYYGGGPAVVNLISAVPKVDYIVFAEFVKANRQSVSDWIEGKSGGHDWMPFLRHIVNNLEGTQGEEAVLKRQKELKEKITSVVPCDVMKSPIVHLNSADADKLFDVVLTSSCLEHCVQSAEHYRTVVKSLVAYLKPGGFLIMSGVLEQTFHYVGSEKFYTFYLTRSIVDEAMKEAGCHNVVITTKKLKKTGVNSDCQYLFVCHGKK